MPVAPVVLVTGIAPDPMAAATIALQWDLPAAVVVEHRIDAKTARLRWVVSDVTGVLEQVEIDLAHACVSCAVREDVVPTLHRLATAGRWDFVIAHLPAGAEAAQVCRVAACRPPGEASLRIHGVLAALDGDRAVEDLLGDALLAERGLASSAEDVRGVGEVGAALVEYADVVALTGRPGAAEVDLVRALARPDALVLPDGAQLEGRLFLTGRHRHEATESWVARVRRAELPPSSGEHVWTLDLSSWRPLHPERLQAAIEDLGGGPRRSRGCFWLPTRPGELCVWDGSGGPPSIGSAGGWGRGAPITRITVTGIDDGAAEISAASEHCLLTDAELGTRGTIWEVVQDGFEPWLGAIRRVA